ncbi:MAG: ABC transporter ATP-binding protein [Bacteroidetes bacterium GWE2_39_28]|nr:MAG: ABC transporter ATP-binding protein [Bacteroidetes bacterium GWE2_39_28]OFY12602.1 MAG: ABC transporter ATP-binding protein [Bacteroidetes bacterium GWF2_39_10]OFZ12468.1 MAG: ABC transporter ATP-binding protein [Bacteroidetes bacterium RIFOXYC2_FULL_39_11]HCT94684.1 ABC transporter ATP-binding protein [Rikenellaceae bacterium]
MDIITCQNVVKKFNDFTALDNVSISVPKGKIFGLLGPNGAGKTTLIRIMNQITLPDSGEVLFNGVKLQRDDISYIGYLPEERGLYKKMKVGDQALYLARLKGLSKEEATRELKHWFIKFGIQAWWNKKVEELSKGMAQKVQFICTILHKPSLLILDEPFSGFDPVNVQLVRNEILQMKDAGTSVILSTHNMESVEELCDNIALINKAKLIITGELDQIRRDHGKNEVEVIYRSSAPYAFAGSDLISLVNQEETKRGYRAILEVKKDACSSEILRSLVSEVDILSYRELIPRMNDIFIKLVS